MFEFLINHGSKKNVKNADRKWRKGKRLYSLDASLASLHCNPSQCLHPMQTVMQFVVLGGWLYLLCWLRFGHHRSTVATMSRCSMKYCCCCPDLSPIVFPTDFAVSEANTINSLKLMRHCTRPLCHRHLYCWTDNLVRPVSRKYGVFETCKKKEGGEDGLVLRKINFQHVFNLHFFNLFLG